MKTRAFSVIIKPEFFITKRLFAVSLSMLFVLNRLNPQLKTTLTLTITGPGGYSFFDFQPINVSANSVGEYSFSWLVPNVEGTYMVETSLVTAQLTAYDAKWVAVG
jgi:hypothetical protein